MRERFARSSWEWKKGRGFGRKSFFSLLVTWSFFSLSRAEREVSRKGRRGLATSFSMVPWCTYQRQTATITMLQEGHTAATDACEEVVCGGRIDNVGGAGAVNLGSD